MSSSEVSGAMVNLQLGFVGKSESVTWSDLWELNFESEFNHMKIKIIGANVKSKENS